MNLRGAELLVSFLRTIGARRNRIQTAKDELSWTQLNLIKRISAETDEEKRASLAKQLSDIHDGLEAIQMAGGKSLSRRAVWLSSISTLLAAIALLFNTNTWYRQQDAKRAEAALTWCAKLYEPNYVAYQSIVRELREAKSDVRLPNGLTIQDLNRNGPNGSVDEVMLTSLKDEIDKRIPRLQDPTKIDLYASLIGLLNLIDVGSIMVLQGDMEGPRFVNCFRDFAEAYKNRFDYSFVGLKYATLTRAPNKKLDTSLEVFPSLACVFYQTNCVAAEEKLWNHKISCRPSGGRGASGDFCGHAGRLGFF